MRVYVVATRPFVEKVVDNKFFFTSKEAYSAYDTMENDMKPHFSVYAADIEIEERLEQTKNEICFRQPFKQKQKAIDWIAGSKKRSAKRWRVRVCPNCYRWHATEIVEPSPPRKTCKKIKYDNRDDAEAVANKHNRNGDNWVGTYWCDTHKAWHVGHIPLKTRERILKEIIYEYNAMAEDEDEVKGD